jgi:hypothetical protein
MAIGLKNIRQRKSGGESERQNASSQSYPWSNSLTESSQDVPMAAAETPAPTPTDLPRDQRAREAVLKARKIAEDNRQMILGIHERRLGKDVRPLAVKDSWSRNDDYLFFVRNNHPSRFGLLDKFRNWIWGEKNDDSREKISE